MALALRPDYANAHNSLGSIYGELGLIDMAIEQYQLAVRFQPNDPDSHYNLGMAFVRKGMMDYAINQFKVAAVLDPAALGISSELSAAQEIKGRQQ